jgi:hypothetical protein
MLVYAIGFVAIVGMLSILKDIIRPLPPSIEYVRKIQRHKPIYHSVIVEEENNG